MDILSPRQSGICFSSNFNLFVGSFILNCWKQNLAVNKFDCVSGQNSPRQNSPRQNSPKLQNSPRQNSPRQNSPKKQTKQSQTK